MEVVITSEADAGRLASRAIIDVVAASEKPTLGLATGSSPNTTYTALIDAHRRGDVSFATSTLFTLDEYVGLDQTDPASYAATIRAVFTTHVDVPNEAVHGPDGKANNPATAALEYDAMIAASGGIDVQLLGIGTDGHIGFNEPGSSLGSRTRLKTLDRQTIEDNRVHFTAGSTVPRHVITQGIGTILEARHLILLAFGEHKADAIADAIEGPITASCPASALQLHPHVTVIVDDAAGSRLGRLDYYRETFEGKPPWQTL